MLKKDFDLMIDEQLFNKYYDDLKVLYGTENRDIILYLLRTLRKKI